MKGEPGDDELVAIVAAYVILTRERRRLAAVPPPDSRWRRTARLEALEAAGAGTGDVEHRARWRAPLAP
jgi:hypothetical protein